MINVYFRTVDENGETGYFGYASAKDGVDLFWLIDEFIDPHQVQICRANGREAFMTKTKIYDDGDGNVRWFKGKAEYSESLGYAVMDTENWFYPEIIGYEMLVKRSKKRG